MEKKDLVRSLIVKIEDLLVEAENNNIRCVVEEKVFLKLKPYVKKKKVNERAKPKLMRAPMQEKLLGKGLIV